MDGYLTDPFIQKLPDNLKASWLPGKSAFSDFYNSISRGSFQVAVSDKNFVDFIEALKINEPELAKSILSLESSGKLRSVSIDSIIPNEFNIPGIRKSAKKQICGGLNVPADTIFHDIFENRDSREKISDSIKKPLFLEVDLTDGTIEYLFSERSFSLNIGDTFNWARFISAYSLPFNRIRILDPYLYNNADNVDLGGLLNALTKNCGNVTIEIISREDKKSIAKVYHELHSIKNKNVDIRLYKQLSDVSDTFHKRLIWTDYWVLFAERGFDFLMLKKGLGEVKKETNLFLTGKYASKESIWHQTETNWQDYLNEAVVVSQ